MDTRKDSKVWTKADIINLIDTKAAAVQRALICIYNKQTEAEKNTDHTKEDNGVGFTAFDAEFMSSCAKFAYRAGFLTDAQLNKVRPKIKKYWKQLLLDMQDRGYQVSLKAK